MEAGVEPSSVDDRHASESSMACANAATQYLLSVSAGSLPSWAL
eukprot:COSAG06_NODE_15154_length_1093_cov_17.990946_2_plen_43_part_01